MNVLVPFAAAASGHDPDAVPTVLLALAFAIVCAKLAGELVQRLGVRAALSPTTCRPRGASVLTLAVTRRGRE